MGDWNYYYPGARGRTLRGLGISNTREEDCYSSPGIMHTRSLPYCSSKECLGFFKNDGKRKREEFGGRLGVVKSAAKRSDTFCPDCGYALYWKPVRSSQDIEGEDS